MKNRQAQFNRSEGQSALHQYQQNLINPPPAVCGFGGRVQVGVKLYLITLLLTQTSKRQCSSMAMPLTAMA